MTATWKCLISWVMEERNKQQQFFFLSTIPRNQSREIHLYSTFCQKGINALKFEKMQIHFQGSHRVFNFWKSLLKFAQQFSRPGKSVIKWNMFLFLCLSLNHEKSICSCFFKSLYRSPILITLSLKKETVVLEQVWKESWFLDPKNQSRTLILKVTLWLLSSLSMLT